MMRRLKGILSGKTEFQIKSAVSRNQQAQPKSGGYRRDKNKQYSKHLGAKVHRTHRRFLISVKPAVEPAKLIRKGRHSYCSALNETRSDLAPSACLCRHVCYIKKSITLAR